MKSLAYVTLALALLGSAAHSACAAERILAKANITLAIRDADDAQCWNVAKGQTVDTSQTYLVASQITRSQASAITPGISQGAATIRGAVVGMIAAQIEAEASQKRAYAYCMQKAGYVYARLTAAEQKTYDLMPDSQRRVWLDAFLRSQRADEATRRLTPELPKNSDGPTFVIVPGSVRPMNGPRRPGEQVLTARATTQALRLKTPFTYDGGKITVAAEEIFLPARITVPAPIVNGMSVSTSEPGWCGAATIAKAKVQEEAICLIDGNDGYQVVLIGPQTLTGVLSLGVYGQVRPDFLTTPLEFAEARLEPLEVSYDLRSARLGPDAAVGAVTANGRAYLLSRAAAGKDGVIDIELGGSLARLTPAGKGKSVTYTVAMMDAQASASLLNEKERLANACGLRDAAERLKREASDGPSATTSATRAALVAAVACVNAGTR